MSRVLIAAPVRQKASILNEFLKSIVRVDKGNNSISYYLVDDNVEAESVSLLKDFAEKHENVILQKAEELLSGVKDNLCWIPERFYT